MAAWAWHLVAWLSIGLGEARLGSGLIQLTSQNFDSFISEHRRVMVDFMNSSAHDFNTDSARLLIALRTLQQIGNSVPVAWIDVMREPEIARRYLTVGCQAAHCGAALPQLLWFQDGDASVYHRHLRTPHNIATFVAILDRDPVTTFTEEPQHFEFNQVVFAKLPRDSHELPALKAAAAQYMDSVAFWHMEADVRNISWIADGLLTDEFTGKVTGDNLASWVHLHVAQSEEPPADALDAGSVVVVGKTFDQTVLRNDRDVMLLVYAPWCGYSRQILPVWAEFAYKASKLPLVVAKMDGTRNRSPTPGFFWTTYPTVVFVRKGEQVAIPFEGSNRTTEALMDFAERHSSEPLFFDRTDEASVLQFRSDVRDESLLLQHRSLLRHELDL